MGYCKGFQGKLLRSRTDIFGHVYLTQISIACQFIQIRIPVSEGTFSRGVLFLRKIPQGIFSWQKNSLRHFFWQEKNTPTTLSEGVFFRQGQFFMVEKLPQDTFSGQKNCPSIVFPPEKIPQGNFSGRKKYPGGKTTLLHWAKFKIQWFLFQENATY